MPKYLLMIFLSNILKIHDEGYFRKVTIYIFINL
jgi:hypothetical protein